MVKLTLVALVALSSLAHARPVAEPDETIDEYSEEPDDDDSPAFNMLGFRASFGALPDDGQRATVFALGLGVEHPVFTKTRVFGEYDWLWLAHQDARAMDSVVARPERYASGHRASVGLRRELLAKGLSRSVRMFVDVELGGGLALVDDSMRGLKLLPMGIGGLRLGYDIYTSSDDSPSRTFEAEVSWRAIAVEDGFGAMLGVGLLWGN